MTLPQDPHPHGGPGPLDRGRHDDPSDGQCAMERVAAIAGQPHSDSPETASPVLAAFVRCLNDKIRSQAMRASILGPRLEALVGTAAHPEVEQARAYLAADAAVRRFGAEALRRLGREDEALALAGLDPIQDRLGATLARLEAGRCGPVIREATWTVTMAARGVTPSTLWVPGCVHMAARLDDGSASWAETAALVLDAMIDRPRVDALYWDDTSDVHRD